MEMLDSWVETLAGWIWGLPLIVLLCGTHLWMTWRTGFVQKRIFEAIRISFSKEKDSPGDVSHFGALTTALAATVGAGNIIGVGVAVAAGGPGAVFWMWLTGVFGMATKYAEGLLAVKYRVKNDRGEMSGGPMFVLERALGLRWLAVLFAIFTAIAAFGIGNMFQAKAISGQVVEMFGGTDETFLRTIVGIVLAVATAAVVIGGIKWIARFCSFFVPLMIVFYIIGCLYILLVNIGGIPAAVWLILTDAFSGQAVAGGALGVVIQQGIKRGLFSNESGLGSAPIAAAAAKTNSPTRQALVSMTGTFWDTVVVCLLTGLVLVVSGAWKTERTGAGLTHEAFAAIPVIGQPVLTLGLLTFVYSTLIGWSYYGEKAIEYLGGLKWIGVYRWLWVLAVFLGATIPSSLVINFADSANGLMAVPNLIALLLLSGVIAAETREYFSRPLRESGER
ncbi:MAG: sodium:alanine symporter family protein [Terrimicrobiaceae bacterium]|nr:sodium:alanine symporter family protein [Terrimicrobiaceae bacterium]